MPDSGAYTGQTFAIHSLRDIYELPTVDMMVRCMKELTILMQIQRRTADLLGATADAQATAEGKDSVSDKIKWLFPDELTWTDDNGGDSQLRFEMGGKEVLTAIVTHKKRRCSKAKKGASQ